MADSKETKLHQITTYAKQRYPAYFRLAQLLKEELTHLIQPVAPHALVQTRPKSVSSFAEKIFRKPHHDPCAEYTDLCGGRVITHTTDEVQGVVRALRDRFEIDAENSVDHTHRLQSREFGYRSVHYIVRFRRGDFKPGYENIRDMENPRAEIQVRTLLEHAWADISYEYAYKPDFQMPRELQREVYCAAAILEESDEVFSRVRKGLTSYKGHYRTYMSQEEILKQIDLLQFVLCTDEASQSERVGLAARIGSLAVELEKPDVWAGAVEILSKAAAEPPSVESPVVFLRLGVLTCNLHSPDSPEYGEGQKHLQKAIDLAPSDIEAHIALARTFEDRGDNDSARKHYSDAFSIDPSNPGVLSRFLGLELSTNESPSTIRYLQPVIRTAISRSREQINVRVNLPWAYYDTGFFHVLLEEWEPALTSYCQGLNITNTEYVATRSAKLLRSLESDAVPERLRWTVNQALVLIGLFSKRFGWEVDTPYDFKLTGPVVIISGSRTDLDEQSRQLHERILRPFLLHFSGMVIIEGVTSGISKIVGKVFTENPSLSSAIDLVGYVPRGVPYNIPNDIRHYKRIITVDEEEYSPRLPLQKWSDILRSQIDIASVKILGIGGDRVSGFEYLMAAALGAEVGLLKGSKGKADSILEDEAWKHSKSLISLPQDPMTISVFLAPQSGRMKDSYREDIARAIHEHYQHDQRRLLPANMASWDDLVEHLKESNRLQADHIADKLRLMGCEIRPKPEGYAYPLVRKLKPDEVTRMAEQEHARWNCERLRDGWVWGPEKDIMGKISPYIVSWEQLPDDVREWDRQAVARIPRLLAEVGLQIQDIGG
ncbi:uncharacterized protein DSM5745_10164 [Aspergillus mulundensis]|uniref:RelA/SpoT domain-containing protein n=1 Tax=Aspergillus mulundensis TaxID=1810919 RepID=A0A3D8QMJ2_9EURO|nr:hypothetical protein DSM5745_10164 [Aspergillus mulundensis]RDW63053.1 hypothetical protein DSM5745_10164 [Aspergillus mulundensis]